jgi:hypothetical protein
MENGHGWTPKTPDSPIFTHGGYLLFSGGYPFLFFF